MFGYTTHVPAPIEAYKAVHQAVQEVVAEHGGGDGLIVHLAYATDQGFDLTEVWESREQFDAFNRDVFATAMARAGVPMEGPEPELVEFDPVGVVAPRAFTTDSR